MIDDLRHHKAPLGAFQLIDPDKAVFGLIVMIGIAAIFWPFL